MVSIHAPVRGATTACISVSRPSSGFNPRARAGRDSFMSRYVMDRVPVSIHAPVRGATVVVAGLAAAIIGFNPRARAGRDASSS